MKDKQNKPYFIAGLTVDAKDADIKERAEQLVKSVKITCRLHSDIGRQYHACRNFTLQQDIQAPELKQGISAYGAVNRMLDQHWWLRQIRKQINRKLEEQEIHTGKVHRYTSAYVSNKTLRRRKAARQRNRRTLEALYLVNEEGTELNLLETAEHSIANPANKRAELMCRIAGFEEYAKSVGNVGIFLTFTCPSRMHARHSRNGIINAKYDGSTPKESNAYLNIIWQQIRAKLSRENIKPYGIRVTEPQHDGTPHWHLLLFVEEYQLSALTDICRTYNLHDSPDEPGAKEHRFKYIEIDWNKGTAAGYIAKYIAKNIDGAHIEKDTLGNDAKETAEKVEAWASVWGIRQFQQIGGSPVTIWRELRKARGQTQSSALRPAVHAADKGKWADFQKISNGIEVPRNQQELHLEKYWDDRPGKYGEPRGYKIFGVSGKGETITTRLHEWKIIQRVPDEMLEGCATARLERSSGALEF